MPNYRLRLAHVNQGPHVRVGALVRETAKVTGVSASIAGSGLLEIDARPTVVENAKRGAQMQRHEEMAMEPGLTDVSRLAQMAVVLASGARVATSRVINAALAIEMSQTDLDVTTGGASTESARVVHVALDRHHAATDLGKRGIDRLAAQADVQVSAV
jgi:hypothetical protein